VTIVDFLHSTYGGHSGLDIAGESEQHISAGFTELGELHVLVLEEQCTAFLRVSIPSNGPRESPKLHRPRRRGDAFARQKKSQLETFVS
jgi:hypothetical protein